MKNEIRYINLDLVSPEMYLALWEYDSVIQLNKPTLIRWRADRTLIDFWEGPVWNDETKSYDNKVSPLSDFFNSPELSDVQIVRGCTQLGKDPGSNELSYYIMDPDITNFIFFKPSIKSGTEISHGSTDVWSAFETATTKVFTERGVQIKNHSNDLFFRDKDGLWKKFIGMYAKMAANHTYIQQDLTITYKFDSDTAAKLRNADINSNLKKSEVSDISTMVGGVLQYNSELNRDEIELDIVNGIGELLGYSISNSSLTTNELSSLYDRGNARLTDEQWYLYGNNDNFNMALK